MTKMASSSKRQPVLPGCSPRILRKHHASIDQPSMPNTRKSSRNKHDETGTCQDTKSKPKVTNDLHKTKTLLSRKGKTLPTVALLTSKEGLAETETSWVRNRTERNMECKTENKSINVLPSRRSARVGLKSAGSSLQSGKTLLKAQVGTLRWQSREETNTGCDKAISVKCTEQLTITGKHDKIEKQDEPVFKGQGSGKSGASPSKMQKLEYALDNNVKKQEHASSEEIQVVATLPGSAIRRSSRKRNTKSALELLGLRSPKTPKPDPDIFPDLTIVKEEPEEEVGEKNELSMTEPSEIQIQSVDVEHLEDSSIKAHRAQLNIQSSVTAPSLISENGDQESNYTERKSENVVKNSETNEDQVVENSEYVNEIFDDSEHKHPTDVETGPDMCEVQNEDECFDNNVNEEMEKRVGKETQLILDEESGVFRTNNVKKKKEKMNPGFNLKHEITKQTGITQAFFELPKVSPQAPPVMAINQEDSLKSRVMITYTEDGQNKLVRIIDVTPNNESVQMDTSNLMAQVTNNEMNSVGNVTFTSVSQDGNADLNFALPADVQILHNIPGAINSNTVQLVQVTPGETEWQPESQVQVHPVITGVQGIGGMTSLDTEGIEVTMDQIPTTRSIQIALAMPDGSDTERQMACEVLAKLASGEGMVVAPTVGEERQLYQVMVIDEEQQLEEGAAQLVESAAQLVESAAPLEEGAETVATQSEAQTPTNMPVHVISPVENVRVPHRVMELGLPSREDGGRIESLPRLEHMKQLIVSAEYEEMVKNLKPSDSLENHATVVSVGRGKKIITCVNCEKQMTNRHAFRRHMVAHKDVEYKPWKCPLCPYKATVRAQIGRHINIHSNIKGYVCKECGKGFNFKQKLVLHMKYHLDIRDKKCHMCYMAFHEYKTLKNHMRKVHGTEEISVAPRRKYVMKEIEELEQKRRTAELANLNDNAPEHLQGNNEEPTAEDELEDEQYEQYESPEREVEEGEELEETDKITSDQTETTDKTSVKAAIHSDAVPAAGSEGEVNNDQNASASDTFTPVIQSKLNEFVLVPCEPDQTSHLQTVDILPDNESNDAEQEHPPGPVMATAITVRRRGHSHYYGTKKTLDYTRKYKEGKHPMADRNNPLQQNNMKKEIIPRKLLHSPDSSGALPENIIVTVKEPSQISPRSKANRDKKFNIVEPDVSMYCERYATEGFAGTHGLMFRCKLCHADSNLIPSKTQFLFHLEQHHREIQPWCCHLCNYSTRMRTSLLVHLKIHSGVKDHACHICGKAFAFKQKLKNHMSYHLNKREYKCSQCEKGFNEKNDLSKHMKRVHTSDRPHACTKCEKTFKDLTQLRRHMVSHADHGRFLCPYCNRYYRSKTSLAQHMKSHTCMFHCEICDKNFGSYSGFMAHKVMHDESYEGYQCDKCPKVLHTKGSLTRHHLVCHSNERPFPCELCSKKFKTKKDLKNHGIVHTNQRQFECSVCHFQCKRVESLKVHMRRHQEVKPYCCGFCGKEYTQKNSLAVHMHTHMDEFLVQCNLCDKNFASKYQLVQHMKRKHADSAILGVSAKTLQVEGQSLVGTDKPLTMYMCEECNAVFITQDNLAVHILAEHMKQRFLNINDPETNIDVDKPNDVGDTVEVVTQPSATATGPSNIEHKVMFDGQDTVETLVAVSDPGGSQSKLVSLIHPVQNQQESGSRDAAKDQQIEPRVEVQHDITSDPDFSFNQVVAEEIEDSTAAENFAALLDPERSGEALVSIPDPHSHQEMLVSVNQSNLETLLAVTESHCVQSLGIEDHYEEGYVAVAETVEIPIAGPTETVLSEDHIV